MMISPECFGDRLKNATYLDLIQERDRLISFLQEFEKKEIAGDRSDPAWYDCPSPDVRYQVYFDYLAVICGIMEKKYNKEYVGGRRTLRDDL